MFKYTETHTLTCAPGTGEMLLRPQSDPQEERIPEKQTGLWVLLLPKETCPFKTIGENLENQV